MKLSVTGAEDKEPDMDTEIAKRAEEMKQTIAELESDGSTATVQRGILARYEAELERLRERPRPTEDHPDHDRIMKSEPQYQRALHARPAAGSAARNQYGTFQVRYATQPQTNYIKSLMDRKDLSKVDPAKVDVEKLREQVAKTQVNKKAASAIIDTLLALPDAAPVSTGRPASDKQKDFLRTLLAERAGNEAAEAIRRSLNEAQATGPLPGSVATQAITALLEIPMTPKNNVPAGRYALPAEDGHYIFYKVDCPTEGKWAGYTFVKQLIGSVGDWNEQRLQRVASQNILARIAADPEEAARMFGIKARACGMCASPLSNTRSRAAGYGETCADNNGFFYPTEDQAREILRERGEE